MRLRFWIILLSTLVFAACAAPGDKPASESTASSSGAPAYTPRPGLDDKARFREALVQLERGESDKARAELALYLQHQPSSKVARDLVRQIDLTAQEYFPPDFREVTLESGVSLSSLSKRYLGSPFKFHALAKYNGILRPGDLTAGHDIKVPLTARAMEVFAAEDAGEIVQDGSVIEPEAVVIDEPAQEASPLEAQAADEAEAVVLETEPEQPVYTAADIDKLHRTALNAYRAQKLDKAIGLWDELLAANPEHESARLYRAQAIELKRKLSNLN